jgi:hypothetical protein
MTGLEPIHNKHDLTPERVETLHSLLDDAARKVGDQRLRIKRLEALLADCAEFIEPYSDVVDGSYGEPSPNAAMSLLSEINEEIT